MANKTHTAQIRELKEELASLKQQLSEQASAAQSPQPEDITEHLNRLTEKVNKHDLAIAAIIPHLHLALKWCFVRARHHSNQPFQEQLEIAGKGLNRLLTKIR